MKIKLKDHNYNRETGETYVKVKTKYGEFEATAKPAAEDFEWRSQFVGGDIAILKCKIKALRKKRLILKERYNGIMHAKSALKHCPKSYTNLALDYLYKIHDLEDEIEYTKSQIIVLSTANKVTKQKLLSKVKKDKS